MVPPAVPIAATMPPPAERVWREQTRGRARTLPRSRISTGVSCGRPGCTRAHGRNFVLTMLRLFRERERGQSRGRPGRHADQRESRSRSASGASRKPMGSRGILHYTDAGVASWYDFAVAIHEEATVLRSARPASFEVVPIATEEYPTASAPPGDTACSTCARRAWRWESCRVHWRTQPARGTEGAASLRRLLVTGAPDSSVRTSCTTGSRQHPADRVVVLDALTYAGNRPRSVSRRAEPAVSLRARRHLRWRPGDAARARASGIDTVVHFAAESHVDRSIAGPDEFIQHQRDRHPLPAESCSRQLEPAGSACAERRPLSSRLDR